jgi:2-methylisocitrate lyase-like PEP mutase family enzyme
MNVQDDRVASFHRLHSSGCFVMPNPWDAGSAHALEQLGFKALATTSAGFAWTLGRADNHVTRDQTLEHLRVVVDAVDVPVNADFEAGFAVDPQQANVNVKLAAATGIAGLSIEDSTGDEAHPQYEFHLAVERVRAARQAIDERGTGIVLTGRSEGFLIGRPDIDETIRRLRAYAEAGADCLYAPRIGAVEHVSAIITAVSPKPVNLLINASFMSAPPSDPDARAVATEYVATSISSGFDPAADAALREVNPVLNPHVRYFDGARRGYLRIDVNRRRLRVEQRSADTVATRRSPVRTTAAFMIEVGVPGVTPA